MEEGIQAWTIPSANIGLDASEVIHQPNADQTNQEGFIYIKTSGSFLQPNMKVSRTGIISTLCNYPNRGKVWKFIVSAFRQTKQTNDFILADERGQVIVFSYEKNLYHVLKVASTAVSAICFIESRKKDVSIAYESGLQIILDSESKDLVMTIPAHYRRDEPNIVAPARLMRSHPSKPLLIDVYDDNTIALWDISKGKLQGEIVVEETIVDVQFELNGEYISIVLEVTGAVWYNSASLQPAFKCVVPSGERQPRWTAYCSSPLNPSSKDTQPGNTSSPGGLRQHFVCMAGDNGNLYSWNLLIPSASMLSTTSTADPQRIESLFTTVVELPPRVSEVSTMSIVHPRSLAKNSSKPASAIRILLSSVEGSVYIVDVTELESIYSIGKYTINGNLSTRYLHGSTREDVVMKQLLRYSSSKTYRRAWVSSHGNLTAIVGADGIARVVDIAAMIGFGDLCGLILRGRGPRDDPTNDKKNSLLELHQQAIQTALKAPASDSNMNKSSKAKGKSNAHRSSLLHIPLFELAAISPEEKRLNDLKLASFFDIHGEFPSRYRSLIWRFLLRLPENSDAFQDYVQRGTHTAFEDLYNQYPVKSRKMFAKLQGTCNQIAHWSYVCAEMEYLPNLVFPFILVFEMDDLAAFEACLSILMNWGYSWSNSYPHPPAHILEILDQLLLLHDKKLYQHLSSTLNISVGLLLWQMLSTLFTEVLSKDVWMKAMDFLFLHFTKPEYLLLFTVSILKSFKPALLVMSIEDLVYAYVRTQQAINIKDTIKMTKMLIANTPTKLYSSYPTPSATALPDTPIDVTSSDVASKSMAFSGGRPVFPLPLGRYPAYNEFPKSIVDWQIKEREKILAMDREMKRKEIILSKLEDEIKSLENSHTDFMKRYEAASAEQIQHHRHMMDSEKSYLVQLQHIEEEISKQRLKSLQMVEESANEELLLLQELSKDAKALLSEKEQHIKQKSNITLDLYKIRELGESAELKAQERRRRMELLRTRQEILGSITEKLDNKEQEFVYEDLMMSKKWRDDEQRMREQHVRMNEESKEHMEKLTHGQIKEDIQRRIQLLELSRQKKLMEIEQARTERLQAYSGNNNNKNKTSAPLSSAYEHRRYDISLLDSEDEDEDKNIPLRDISNRAASALAGSSINDDDDSDIEHPRPSLRIREHIMRSTASKSSSSYSDLKSMANESLRVFANKL